MITDLLWPELNDMDMYDMWFQKESATRHTTNGFIAQEVSGTHYLAKQR